MNTKPQIFLDCDGVLADFDKFIVPHMGGGTRPDWDWMDNKEFWGRLEHLEDLFGSLDKMPDADDLVSGVLEVTQEYGLAMPIILTGKPRLDKYTHQKLSWRDQHFPQLEMIVCDSKNKRKHMKAPGDIIIDDWEKHMQAWTAVGGRWILHKTAKQSLTELRELLEHE